MCCLYVYHIFRGVLLYMSMVMSVVVWLCSLSGCCVHLNTCVVGVVYVVYIYIYMYIGVVSDGVAGYCAVVVDMMLFMMLVSSFVFYSCCWY